MRPWNLTPKPPVWRRWLDGPACALCAALAAAALLVCLPQQWTMSFKDWAALLRQPGCRAAVAGKQTGRRAIRWVCAHFARATQLATLEEELAQLKQQNDRLRRELARLKLPRRATSAQETPASDTLPHGFGASHRADGESPAAEALLQARAIPARVLGAEGRAFLARRSLLDVGSLAGIEPGALVLDGLAASNAPGAGDSPAVLDRGHDAQLAPGQLVLSGACVWGQVVEVGRHVSTVRTVTEPGYRDVVQLADPQAAGRLAAHAPRGLLEGTGGRLARIRAIAVTEPVAEGDLVFSARLRGVVNEPLLYGRVVRVERPAEAPCWEIWMEPAVPGPGPNEVLVLRTELNPLRLADGQDLSRP